MMYMGKKMPDVGEKRTRNRYAVLPVTDLAGERRWLEWVWQDEYWTYRVTSSGPRWHWAVSRVHPRGWQPKAKSDD